MNRRSLRTNLKCCVFFCFRVTLLDHDVQLHDVFDVNRNLHIITVLPLNSIAVDKIKNEIDCMEKRMRRNRFSEFQIPPSSRDVDLCGPKMANALQC